MKRARESGLFFVGSRGVVSSFSYFRLLAIIATIAKVAMIILSRFSLASLAFKPPLPLIKNLPFALRRMAGFLLVKESAAAFAGVLLLALGLLCLAACFFEASHPAALFAGFAGVGKKLFTHFLLVDYTAENP